MDFSGFGSFESLTIPSFFLWIIFLVMLAFYLVMSVIFLYHWNRYGGRNMIVLVGGTAYFIGSIIIIGIATVSLFSLL